LQKTRHGNPGREKNIELRERNRLSAFQSFGLSSELASTLRPSSFQFAFTAHSTFVRRAIYITTHRILSRLNIIRDIEVRQHGAPILYIFLNNRHLLLQRACSLQFRNTEHPRRYAQSMLDASQSSSCMSITKRTLLHSANFFAKFQRVQVSERTNVLRISERGTDRRRTNRPGCRSKRLRRRDRRRTSTRPQPTARRQCP